MTIGFKLHAHSVLKDARLSQEFLEKSEDAAEIRIHWTATVVLLRSVGDVLDKVDRKQVWPEIAEAINWHWTKLCKEKENSIKDGKPHWYWDFIKHERDMIVHNYLFPAELHNFTLIAARKGSPEALGEVDMFLIEYGAFAGEDGRDITLDAINWWESELDELEARILKIRNAKVK